LERVLGPGVAEALARTAGLLRDDADALDDWAERAAEPAALGPGRLDAGVLAGLPRAVRTRVLRRAALDAGAPAGALNAGHVAELERLVTEWRGQAHVDLPGGLRGRREDGAVLIGGGPGGPRPARGVGGDGSPPAAARPGRSRPRSGAGGRSSTGRRTGGRRGPRCGRPHRGEARAGASPSATGHVRGG